MRTIVKAEMVLLLFPSILLILRKMIDSNNTVPTGTKKFSTNPRRAEYKNRLGFFETTNDDKMQLHNEEQLDKICVVLTCAVLSNQTSSLNGELHWRTSLLFNILDTMFGETREVAIQIHILAFKKDFIFIEQLLKNLTEDGRKYRKIESTVSLVSLEEIIIQYSVEISRLRRFYSYQPVSGKYSKPFFHLRPIYHKIFKSEDLIISLDSDMEFRNDIKVLHREFKKMDNVCAIAIASEQSPYYREAFKKYRMRNKGTTIGSPHPGYQGFNTGVVLLHLRKLRMDERFSFYLSETGATFLQKKYEMEALLGDQDFFTLLGAEEPSLFSIFDCSWNKQLSTGWSNDAEFKLYRDCKKPAKIYHGNSYAGIPEE